MFKEFLYSSCAAILFWLLTVYDGYLIYIRRVSLPIKLQNSSYTVDFIKHLKLIDIFVRSDALMICIKVASCCFSSVDIYDVDVSLTCRMFLNLVYSLLANSKLSLKRDHKGCISLLRFFHLRARTETFIFLTFLYEITKKDSKQFYLSFNVYSFIWAALSHGLAKPSTFSLVCSPLTSR